MKIIGSAEKRQRQAETRRMRNRKIKSIVKTSVRRYTDAIKDQSREKAEVALKVLVSDLDKAVTKGVYHKNMVARKKSRMYRMLATIQA